MGYIAQELDVPAGEAVRVVQCANVNPVACVTWGDGSIRVGVRGGFRIPALALAGPLDTWFANVFEGSVRGFFVRFAPAGALALLGVEGRAFSTSPRMEDLVDQSLTGEVRRWGEAIVAARGFAARVHLTDRLLLDRLAHVHPRAALAASAAALVEATSGRMKVKALAAELGVGESTLRRRFRDDLGIAAKRFGDIVRFRQAHAFLHSTPHARWADAAHRFGYADQAHLIRDYQRFAGVSPTRWRAELRHIDLNFGLLDGAPPEPAAG